MRRTTVVDYPWLLMKSLGGEDKSWLDGKTRKPGIQGHLTREKTVDCSEEKLGINAFEIEDTRYDLLDKHAQNVIQPLSKPYIY